MIPAVVIVDSGRRREFVREKLLPAVFDEFPGARVVVVGGHRTRYAGAVHVPFVNRLWRGGWVSRERNVGCDVATGGRGPVLVLDDSACPRPGSLAVLESSRVGDVSWPSKLSGGTVRGKRAVFVRDWGIVPRWDETLVGDAAVDAVHVEACRAAGCCVTSAGFEIAVDESEPGEIEVPPCPLVGLMTTRNEADVVEEGLDAWADQLDAVFVMDDSVDGTREIAASHPIVCGITSMAAEYGEEQRPRDWMREALLRRAQAVYGHRGWLVLAHPDVFLNFRLDSVLSNVADPVICVLTQSFFLKDPEDRSIRYDRRVSPSRQLRWYDDSCWEELAFANVSGLSYAEKKHSKLIPDELENAPKLFDPRLTARHYSFRHPDDVLARARDRMERGWTTSCYEEIVKTGSPFFERLPGCGSAKKLP